MKRDLHQKRVSQSAHARSRLNRLTRLKERGLDSSTGFLTSTAPGKDKLMGQGSLPFWLTPTFWDLETVSKPFEDTSYKPEFCHPISGFPGHGSFVRRFSNMNPTAAAGNIAEHLFFVYQAHIYCLHKNTKLGIMIAPKIWNLHCQRR